jgi:isoquinoline 1-oxidoreductase alpha subunit
LRRSAAADYGFAQSALRAEPDRPWVSHALNPGYNPLQRADLFSRTKTTTSRANHFAPQQAANGRPGMPTLIVNGHSHNVDVEPDTPLLWVLRDTLGLTGTKYGCGIAQCGACTVHVDGVAVRSCSVQYGDVAGKQITTIEGLAANGVLHKVQHAWLEHDVPQCGYCQSGMIMAVADLLKSKPKPSDADIDAAITNICRCGTFQQVRAAIHAAANA